MNQFNDDQYGKVCDENEQIQKDINRLEAIVEDRNEAIAVFQDVVERQNVENTRLRSLLREALEAAWLDDEWWGNEIPDEWFVRVKAALEGKS